MNCRRNEMINDLETRELSQRRKSRHGSLSIAQPILSQYNNLKNVSSLKMSIDEYQGFEIA